MANAAFRGLDVLVDAAKADAPKANGEPRKNTIPHFLTSCTGTSYKPRAAAIAAEVAIQKGIDFYEDLVISDSDGDDSSDDSDDSDDSDESHETDEQEEIREGSVEPADVRYEAPETVTVAPVADVCMWPLSADVIASLGSAYKPMCVVSEFTLGRMSQNLDLVNHTKKHVLLEAEAKEVETTIVSLRGEITKAIADGTKPEALQAFENFWTARRSKIKLEIEMQTLEADISKIKAALGIKLTQAEKDNISTNIVDARKLKRIRIDEEAIRSAKFARDFETAEKVLVRTEQMLLLV